MSSLTIYGTAASRTFRTLWMAEELGIPYEHVRTDFRKGENRAPEFLKLNPNGHIPVIRDEAGTLWESLAINLYLAKRHPGPLTPANLQEEAKAIQWSMWALTEPEPPIVMLIRHLMLYPEAKRDPNAVAEAYETLKGPFSVLDAALKGRDWLIAGRFTVADLNVCGVVATARRFKVDFAPFPDLDGWITRCTGRPAAQKADALRREAMAA